MEFKIDYGTQTYVAAPPPPQGPLYASIDGRASSLANGEVVFFVPETGKSHVMTDQVLQALNLCREFRTMDEHVARVTESIEGLRGQHEGVRRVLEGLIRVGLVISEETLQQRCREAAPLVQAPFFGLCIRACDRPAQLRALLASLLAYEQRFSPRHRYLVVDDSRDPENAREHQRLVQEFASEAGVQAQCLGREAWDGMVDLLVREVPGGEALRVLLQRGANDASPRGGGIGKNLITLLCAGQRYALLDDDFSFPLRRHPEYEPGLDFSARSLAPRTFASRSEALAAGEELEQDPLSAQLALCGNRLGAIVGSTSELSLQGSQLRGIDYSRSRTLRPEARISMTVNGHRGSAGASGMAWLFALGPRARAGLVADRDTYLASLTDPAVWLGTRSYRVAMTHNFTPFLVDNARLMPCTSPFGRSEDALFSALSALCHRDGVVLETPFAIGHSQEPGRGRQAALQRPETPDLNLCLTELARQMGPEVFAADPGRRLQAFGYRLLDLAAADDAGIVSHLREYLAYLRTTVVQSLQASLAATKEPPIYWAADLRSVVEANGKTLTEPKPPRFGAWPEDIDEAGCVARFRGETTSLAEGIALWPQAFEAAGQLRERLLSTL